MVLQEIFVVIDGLMYLPNEETFSSYKNYVTTPSDNGYDWEMPFCVELDIKSNENPSNHRFRIYDTTALGMGAWVSDLNSLRIRDNNYHHLKVKVYNNEISVQLDNSTPVIYEKSFDGKLRVNFTSYGSDTPSTSVKNFCIYPI